MPFPSPAACGAPNPCWAKLTPLSSSRALQCCGGQGEENQRAPDQDMSRGCGTPWAPHEMWTHCHSSWHSFCKWFQTSNGCCTADILLKPGALQNPALNMSVTSWQWVKTSMWICVSKWSHPTNHISTTECNYHLGVSLFFSYFPFSACFLVVFSSICDYSIFNLPMSFHKISSV